MNPTASGSGLGQGSKAAVQSQLCVNQLLWCRTLVQYNGL